MENIYSVRNLLLPGVFMVTLVLQDAYLHVPICQNHQKFLRFAVLMENGPRHWQFRALPFGFSAVPTIFTRILAKAGAYFRIQRVSIVPYLDYFFGLCPREREPCSGSAIDLADLLEIGVEGQSAKVLSDSLPEHVLVGLPNTQLPKRFFFRKKRF